jgi:hypothetical protein
MTSVPNSLSSNPRSISTRAMTGFAELARFMPTKRASASRWDSAIGPQNDAGSA